MTTIKFVTDSAADIPRALREELDIQVLPFPIAMGAKELQDGYDFTPEQFYPMLLAAKQIPTHAQLNPFVFSQCFQETFQAGYSCLIYTAINAKGSATYQNALQAREEFYEDYPEAKATFHIHILDSRTYTMGYGWAVLQGARMARDGAGEEEILAYLQDWIDHVRVLFAPLDLRFAKKSGRISAAAAFKGAGGEERDPRPVGAVPEDPGPRHPLSGDRGEQPGAGRPPGGGERQGPGGARGDDLPHRRRHRHQRRAQPDRPGLPAGMTQRTRRSRPGGSGAGPLSLIGSRKPQSRPTAGDKEIVYHE